MEKKEEKNGDGKGNEIFDSKIRKIRRVTGRGNGNGKPRKTNTERRRETSGGWEQREAKRENKVKPVGEFRDRKIKSHVPTYAVSKIKVKGTGRVYGWDTRRACESWNTETLIGNIGRIAVKYARGLEKVSELKVRKSFFKIK